ncbi:hypothetical protein AAFC00_003045 [Neodothiora populina]|uniref:Glycosyl hydrolase family 13 catalytic domain-containing protein n=1 Tax=Neodothiora populina TaxID=2781224 RepID=A0ABR3P933_9PEZI
MSSWFKERLLKAESKIEQHFKDGPPEQEHGVPTPQNRTLFQAFEWHSGGQHWTHLTRELPSLAEIGVTNIWLPPGCKANSPKGNGYDCYDLWDLGEFDQKWTKATKWGSRQELDDLIASAKGLGVGVIWDAVLNHKTAGDSTEECWAVEVDAEDRRQETSRPKKIEPWIHYNFPGRGDTYSPMKWHWQHFNGTDWDQHAQRHAIYKIIDPPETAPRPGQSTTRRPKGWAPDVDDLHGNADYLMFSNIDHANPEVREDLMKWGQWMVRDVGVDGFRLDAVPHYSWNFARDWVCQVIKAAVQQRRDLLILGEYWMPNVAKIVRWVDNVGQGVKAIDAPLYMNFSKLSQSKFKLEADLRRVYRDTLVAARPDNAVTMITSHDTQPGQTMATRIEPYFKMLAYAIMLLRKEGLPSVFYGDVYGTKGPHAEPRACDGKVPALVLCRKLYAYGKQADYFDSRSCIGWVRQGTWDKTDGCAVVMSIQSAAKLTMFVGEEHAGQQWTDVLGNREEAVDINGSGYGNFPCSSKSVSVWVKQNAQGRDQFPHSCGEHRFRSN